MRRAASPQVMRGVSWLARTLSLIMRTTLPFAFLCLACATPGPAPDARPIPGEVIPEAHAAALLHPCTRPGPEPIEGIWQPDTITVRKLEAGIAAYIKSASYERPGRGPTYPLSEYRGQFTGFVQGDTRWIYGAFARNRPAATTGPMVQRWCDGGGAYFGVEFNPTTGEYRNLARNAEGSVGGP
jgi:hypothetical protein